MVQKKILGERSAYHSRFTKIVASVIDYFSMKPISYSYPLTSLCDIGILINFHEHPRERMTKDYQNICYFKRYPFLKVTYLASLYSIKQLCH